MANLVKIHKVILYTTIRESAECTANCDAARELLTSNGIAFQELWYNDEKINERKPVLEALSTWNWGVAGSKGPRQMTEFPLVHWTECYDNWEAHADHAHGLDEIKASSLLINKALVEKPPQ